MPSYVYVIASARGGKLRSYVGWSTDPQKRLEQHNSGRGAKSTRGGVWALLYIERYRTRGQAMKREWALKHDRAFRARLKEYLT
jgi:putative endonuclease